MAREPIIRENELFRGDPENIHLNATVGDNGGRYDLYDYALGYFDASLVLLRAAHEPGALIDCLVYPTCYNYRHSLELFLKWLVQEMGRVLRDDAIRPAATHDLASNWEIAQAGFQRLPARLRQDGETELIATAIRCIHEIDPSGMVFRFSDDRRDQQHLKEWSLINLTVLLRHAEQAIEVMKDWNTRLERFHEDQRHF